MTYASFLLYFVVAPGLALAVLGTCYARKLGWRAVDGRRHWLGTGILSVIAIGWTTPWDNFIVAQGVWSYGPNRVMGTIGVVPIEEYAFMVLMPLAIGTLLPFLFSPANVSPSRWRKPQRHARRIVLCLAVAAWMAGFVSLRFEAGLYLGAILVWFVPPLALQGFFDPALIRRHWRGITAGTSIPAGYLSVADAFAIREGIWTIHEQTRSGLEIAGLPFEEGLFFFVTSLLVAQGLYLWHSLFRPHDHE